MCPELNKKSPLCRNLGYFNTRAPSLSAGIRKRITYRDLLYRALKSSETPPFVLESNLVEHGKNGAIQGVMTVMRQKHANRVP